jgi:neutral ceramidase
MDGFSIAVFSPYKEINMNGPGIMAGAGRVKTTPPLGTRINGDFVTHYATFIHDDLFSKALVLQREDVKIALVVVDICIMPNVFIEGVKRQITEATGIPASHIMISSTHTHAAGSVADVHLGSLDPAYTLKLPGLIVESVLLALSRMKPAKVGFGSAMAPEHLLCRRYEMKEGYVPFNPVTGAADLVKTNPFGHEDYIAQSVAPTDPEVGYLAVKGEDGSWISLIANYSLHYVGDWENGTISADYFGYFCGAVTAGLGASDDFVAMLSNGTSGDVNIWDFLNPGRYPSEHFEKSRYIGEDVASKVLASLDNIAWQDQPELSVFYDEVDVAVVKPSLHDLQKAAAVIATSSFENIVVDEQGLRQIYAREQLLLDEFNDTRLCPIQAIRIGGGVIGALPAEFFSETGLYLKAENPAAHYFTITMANGNLGYIPPAHEIAKGGYETWRCRYSCLVPGAEELIRERLLALIHNG